MLNVLLGGPIKRVCGMVSERTCVYVFSVRTNVVRVACECFSCQLTRESVLREVGLGVHVIVCYVRVLLCGVVRGCVFAAA